MYERMARPTGLVLHSYEDDGRARAAVRSLIDAGYSPDSISVIARDECRAHEVAEDTGADTAEGAGIGAVTGGVLGGLAGLLLGATAVALPGIGIVVAGPLASILAGAGVGGVAGGLTGALVGLGLSNDEAERYGERIEAGDVVVAVAAGHREHEARQILR